MSLSELPVLRVLRWFMAHPDREPYLRQLAKELKLNLFTTKKNLDELVADGMLLERRAGRERYFRANTKSPFFRQLKIAFTVQMLADVGLIEHIRARVPALSAIVLFGSHASGDDTPKSDIDLLIIGYKRPLELGDIERRLGKEISPIVRTWAQWKRQARTNRALYLDIISNGIALFGNKPVID